jgi:RNA polymerase sigma-70 factor, ECF subfamily
MILTRAGQVGWSPANATCKKKLETFFDWAALEQGIRENNGAAVQQFYDVFNGGFRYFIRRQLGLSDLEDSVHDCVLAVITAVRRGAIRQPERFVGFVNTVVKRHIAQKIAERIVGRSESDIESAPPSQLTFIGPSPEAQAITTEARTIARLALNSLSNRDRDVLRRFYLLDQTEGQIRQELNLSFHVFKNIKHRAKNKFAEQWHKHAGSASSGALPVAVGSEDLGQTA